MYRNDIPEKKQEIIEKTWKYMLKTGLAGASIGDLCREMKCSQSSLYYWFENKDAIWISAGKYGLSNVVSALFDYTMKSICDVQNYFDTLILEIDKYKYEIRLAVQITTSPVFGERMREKSMEFNAFYERYAHEIMKTFECSYLQAEVFIYSLIAFVVDYAIWEDKTNTKILLDNLYNRVTKVITNN